MIINKNTAIVLKGVATGMIFVPFLLMIGYYCDIIPRGENFPKTGMGKTILLGCFLFCQTLGASTLLSIKRVR